MGSKVKQLLTCFGIALVSLLLINSLLFGWEILQNGISSEWAYRFKHGAFYANNKLVGHPIGSQGSILIMVFSFGYAFYQRFLR